MSRGGRGGFGGRGGRGGGGVGGVDIPAWDPELKLDNYNKPSELFPPVKPPLAAPPTRQERTQVARYRALRDRIHEGPLYTVLGDNVRVKKPDQPKVKISYNPFNSTQTYTAKYTRKARAMPALDTRPYIICFFPVELHSTLDRSMGKTSGSSTMPRKVPRRRLQIDKSTLPTLEELEAEEQRRNLRADDSDVEDVGDEDEEQQEQEEDDAFSEDEDDENNDYNAEQYFDDGEADDYDEGGDDGGGYDY
ncbi:hypothetical protein M501DRAFT_994399 [Patellaria atrata CBS 101060]|uniref:DNA-directed RNA polymerase III subunit n=1 Tax=Patellaria atrata CBS 101060 TaxID=1346257 RepID=A0A9P4VTS0_9PEZI|nr:hypothetical protein M501DRAFT_994399 [Patellaria atrata CBS 101060]